MWDKPIPPGPFNSYGQEYHDAALEFIRRGESASMRSMPGGNETEVLEHMAMQAEVDGYQLGYAWGRMLGKQFSMEDFDQLRIFAENCANWNGYRDMRLGNAYIRAFGQGYVDAVKGTPKSQPRKIAAPIENEEDYEED